MEEKKWEKEELEEIYENIKRHQPEQMKNYAKFLQNVGEKQIAKWRELAESLQLELDINTGRIKYKNNFKPLDIPVEICYVRHGKTQGNTEPRVFQGQVDYPNNQLNALGLQQAEEAAERLSSLLHANAWGPPDIIISSPLMRAQQTAKPFADKNKQIQFEVLPEAAEMKFGEWDNAKVISLCAEDCAHLFYLQQNAVVKTNKSHKVNLAEWISPQWLNGKTQLEAENFLECMERQRKALYIIAEKANEAMKKKQQTDENRKARAVVYGHSMAGAAVSILLGFGKTDSLGFLGFDGSFIMPNATPTLLIPNKP